MSTLAWIGDPAAGPRSGLWGAPGALSLPLDDRGLGLADGLFETVRVENGHALLLREHLERWDRAAALLAMAPPPANEAMEALLAEAVARSGQGDGALRLNWSRGRPPSGGSLCRLQSPAAADLPHPQGRAIASGCNSAPAKPASGRCRC